MRAGEIRCGCAQVCGCRHNTNTHTGHTLAKIRRGQPCCMCNECSRAGNCAPAWITRRTQDRFLRSQRVTSCATGDKGRRAKIAYLFAMRRRRICSHGFIARAGENTPRCHSAELARTLNTQPMSGKSAPIQEPLNLLHVMPRPAWVFSREKESTSSKDRVHNKNVYVALGESEGN